MCDLIWPEFTPPPMHKKPPKGWDDPELPDFKKIWAVARDFGYTVALHGSMIRDVDLIAVPWTEEAADPDILVNHLCDALDAKRVGVWEQKPHGRIAITLAIEGWFKPIDLAVTPKRGA